VTSLLAVAHGHSPMTNAYALATLHRRAAVRLRLTLALTLPLTLTLTLTLTQASRRSTSTNPNPNPNTGEPPFDFDYGADGELVDTYVGAYDRLLACVRGRIRVSRDGGLCSVAKAYAFVMGEWP
jgi:hypothetical protein